LNIKKYQSSGSVFFYDNPVTKGKLFFYEACTFAPIRCYPYLGSQESWRWWRGTATPALGKEFVNKVIINRV